jgi:phosphoglycerate dehydrogenase-like enzyme
MKHQKRALITAEFDPAGVARLGELGYVVQETGWGQTGHALSGQELMALMPGTSLLIVEVEHVSTEVITAAPELDVIATCRAGPVNVEVAAATARGIPVLSTPARNADSVADFAVGVMLALCRDIHRAELHLRQKGWMVQTALFSFPRPGTQWKDIGADRLRRDWPGLCPSCARLRYASAGQRPLHKPGQAG